MKNLPKAPHSTQETKHTPTPWKLKYEGSNGQTGNIFAGISQDGKEEWDIAAVWADCENRAVTKENAKFIIRACNAHDELVEALDVALSWAEYETEYDGRMYAVCNSCGGQDNKHTDSCDLPKFKAALAKARGESA